MTDMEMIIEGLEHCSRDNNKTISKCYRCPYMPQCEEGEYDYIKKDALDLIKELNKTIDNLLSQIGKQAGMLEDRNSMEQKSMENVIHLYDNYYVGTCPSCGKAFSTNGGTAIFCKYCGQAVKWE